MSTALFPFRFLKSGFAEYLSFSNAIHEQGGGRRTLQKVHAAGEFVARGRLLFPQPGKVWRDFEDFWAARFGGFDPFLYKAQSPGAKVQGDAFSEDIGNGRKDFTLARRYVDAATVVVKKNGTTQSLGTHYSLQNESGGAYALGTSTKCVVHFVTAPVEGSVITVDYEFYFPVRFEGDDLPEDQDLETGGGGSAKAVDRTVAVRMRETGPGYSYSLAPNSL